MHVSTNTHVYIYIQYVVTYILYDCQDRETFFIMFVTPLNIRYYIILDIRCMLACLQDQ
jgi:hypothetical protein